MSSNIIPTLRYNDAPAAIEWLCDVFGFNKRVVYESDALPYIQTKRSSDRITTKKGTAWQWIYMPRSRRLSLEFWWYESLEIQ